jgi:hypothetical protein
MKASKMCRMVRRGAMDAAEMGLDKEENWTPVLCYVHVTRFLVGLVIGLAAGIPAWTLLFLNTLSR